MKVKRKCKYGIMLYVCVLADNHNKKIHKNYSDIEIHCKIINTILSHVHFVFGYSFLANESQYTCREAESFPKWSPIISTRYMYDLFTLLSYV